MSLISELIYTYLSLKQQIWSQNFFTWNILDISVSNPYYFWSQDLQC